MAGGTHHALEDLALLRCFPNMTVIVPADAEETYQAALATIDMAGPVAWVGASRTRRSPRPGPRSGWAGPPSSTRDGTSR